MQYKNPVIPGFHPDPSICRVGHDYYLVTSSFEYFPGVPIWHSRDLLNWTQIGHCLTRQSQLELTGCAASGGIWAPTIRHHNGVFYMVTKLVHGEDWYGRGHFYVFATDPAGDWSDPIWVKQEGIDPSLFFDDDGRCFLTSNGGADGQFGIIQCEIDIETGKKMSATKFLWAGSGGAYIEAPHMYKVNGWYYLLVGEGGTEYGHMVTIARSKNPWGPFEACPANPILSHRSTDSPVQGTGHADLIQAPNGSWWAVFLGFRPITYPPCHHLGRETFLAPVSWTADGWPVIGNNGRIALEMNGEGLVPHPIDPEPVRDEFNSKTLHHCWNFLRNPDPSCWSLSKRPGSLSLTGSTVTLDEVNSPAFIARRQQHFECRIATHVQFDPAGENDEAGLTVFMNELHHYEIGIRRASEWRCVFVRRRIGSMQQVVAETPIQAGPVDLHVDADNKWYTFSFVQKEQEPKILAKGECKYLSKEIAGGFTGVFIGMYATGNGKPCGAPAYFDWFEYEGK